jgi:hypothetical protein
MDIDLSETNILATSGSGTSMAQAQAQAQAQAEPAKIFVSLVRTISLLQDMKIDVQFTISSLLNQ